eukprot:6546792-Prymnesium_polylepis.1
MVDESTFEPVLEVPSPSPAKPQCSSPHIRASAAWAANAELQLIAADNEAAEFELLQVLSDAHTPSPYPLFSPA